jgi:hypothetical protein
MSKGKKIHSKESQMKKGPVVMQMYPWSVGEIFVLSGVLYTPCFHSPQSTLKITTSEML